MQPRTHTGNPTMFVIGTVFLIGFTLLFAWQTWEFVNWLFPNDALLMRVLALVSFDIMAMVWACLDLFYRFASKGSRTLVRAGWFLSFIFSLIATVLFFCIHFVFRFGLEITPEMVIWGYAITILSVVLNVIFLTFWWYIEWSVRHPQQDDYVIQPPPVRRTTTTSRRPAPVRVKMAQTATLPPRQPRQLPAPMEAEPDDEIEDGEEDDEAEIGEENEGSTNSEAEEAYLEELSGGNEGDEYEEEAKPPLGQRLAAAKDALFPTQSGKRSLHRRE